MKVLATIIIYLMFQIVSANIFSGIRKLPAKFRHSNRFDRVRNNFVSVSIMVQYIPLYEDEPSDLFEQTQSAYILNKKWLLTKDSIFQEDSHGYYPMLNTTVVTIGNRNFSVDKVYTLYNYIDITLVKLKKRIPSRFFSFTPIATSIPAVGQSVYITASDRSTGKEDLFQLTRLKREQCEYMDDKRYCMGLPGKQVSGTNRTKLQDRCISVDGPIFRFDTIKPQIIGMLRYLSFGKCYSDDFTESFYTIIPERKTIHRVIYKNDFSGVEEIKQGGLMV